MKQVSGLLERQVALVLPTKQGLESLLKKKKIRVYLGIDPTGSRLHLGHAIPLRKLQQFADAGNEALLVLGTGTVLAGDPSQRKEARSKITAKEIKENIKTWKAQAGKIIDFSKVKLVENGKWLLPLSLSDIINIASHISASQLFQRDMFKERLRRGDTVWTHELLYPLLQGYDSVALDVDLEIGGVDQTFNMLMGRELQRKMNNREKFVLTVPMILGLDGKTMSKTSRNTVNLDDPPKEMYGKLMTLRDELVPHYFELCTDLAQNEVLQLKAKLSPRDLKARLAKEITKLYHGSKAAVLAEQEFEKVFKQKELPTHILAKKVSATSLELPQLLVELSLAFSKTEARRLIEQGGVKVNGEVKKDWKEKITLKKGMVAQVGKRHFAKIA